jgi:phage tail-like protein
VLTVDANRTRFHLLLGERDWRDRTTFSQVEWHAKHQDVILERRAFHFPAAEADRPPRIEDRRGAARDVYGNWYWIADSSTEILVRSAGRRMTSTFWSPAIAAAPARERRPETFAPLDPVEAPRVPAALRGLTVTSNHYLIAGTLEPNGLLVFDLHGGGASQHLCWPEDVRFSPFDMAPSVNGGAWILDRDNSLVWELDAVVRVVTRPGATPATEPFSTVDPITLEPRRPCPPPVPIRVQDAWPAPPHSVSIETLPNGALVILDRPPGSSSTIHYYAAAGSPAVPLSLDSYGTGIVGQDVAFVPSRERREPTEEKLIGELFVVAHEGNQAYAFTLHRDTAGVHLGRVPQYFPMRQFGGKGLVAAAGGAYYDFDRTWIPLVDQPRPRHLAEGAIDVKAMDGRDPDCVWHRLLIDGCIPPDASLEVWSRAANEEEDLEVTVWQREPMPYRRGPSELPWPPAAYSTGVDTWELLFQNARGRYLQLRLLLKGNGRSTPRLRAVRAYYPRFSYLQYLPAVYREDRESASFLDRFLANVEGTLTSIEDRIAASQALIDVRSASPDTLEWLASWIGLALDPAWDEHKRRLLIQHAPIVFARRGTIEGLRIALALSLFDCATAELFTNTSSTRSPAAGIRIVEQFRTRRVPAVVSGDPTQTRTTGLREVLPALRWTPTVGRDGLDAAWDGPFPLSEPDDLERARAWREIADRMLGFVPAITRIEAARWRRFLAGRYHGINTFNEVYSRTGYAPVRSFDEITVPEWLPPDGVPLVDWYEFETRVIAMALRAHRFLVLLPMDPSAQADSPQHAQRLELARRVATIEKPAHTSFDVRFYWALFRVGEVRLGYDTQIGPRRNLVTPFVLDRGHLGENYLAPGHPQNVRGRSLVTGRDRLEPPCTTGEGS